jgi:hypothetical protein
MIKQGLKYSRLTGLDEPYWYDGPLPAYNHCGYEVTIQMVLKSRSPAKHASTYTQFDTIRKIRTGYGNFLRSSTQTNSQVTALGDEKGRYQRFSMDPCGSLWFHRFVTGCRYRMGMDWRPNEGKSIDLILAVLEQVEDRINDAPMARERNRWIVFHTFSVVAYIISLRGMEGFLLDVDGLRWHRQSPSSDHVIVALLGKIKSEHHDLAHLIPCVQTTGSGIDVRRSLERLLDLKEGQGLVDGPAISDASGQAYKTRDINDCFHDVLEDLFATSHSLFPSHITSTQMLRERYQVFRTYRKSSDSRALAQGVSPNDVDVVNRWQAVEKAQGARPNRSMRQYYAAVHLLKPSFLQYTGAM